MEESGRERDLEIRLVSSANFALINQILRHPAIYLMSSDDGTPPPQDIDATGAAMTFLLVYCGERLAGLYALQFHNTVMAEVHTCILPEFRGQQAAVAAQRLIGWAFTNTRCKKITTLVPAFNRGALRYARLAGFQREGLITKSFLKNGVLHDQVLLGLTYKEA
jgi:RimJ/RimL family protein N-acetyltransferase